MTSSCRSYAIHAIWGDSGMLQLVNGKITTGNFQLSLVYACGKNSHLCQSGLISLGIKKGYVCLYPRS